MEKKENPKLKISDLIPFEYLIEASECLKCIAHPQRLRIIEILLKGEFTVGEIAKLCDLTQPATSDHLRLMHGKRLLTSERRNRSVYYSIAEDAPLEGILDCVKAHHLNSK